MENIMQCKININIAVDVAKALSDKSLEGNIYLVDNSPFLSENQGTGYLCTLCMSGQTIHWVSYPIDLQTPLVIKRISFLPEEGCCETDLDQCYICDDPDFKTWTGIIPVMIPGRKYRYRLVLQMGYGKNSIMSIDTPSLTCACACSMTAIEEENKQNQNTTNHE
jgi:hypothetical protein